MENNIFNIQYEFVEYWDNKFIIYENQSKQERLKYFKMLNEKISHFYYTFIDYNIWQIQRAYFFAFWIGILYIRNPDCILEIQEILNFSNIYYPFTKIVAMLNHKVRRIILDSEQIEGKIILNKMVEFDNKLKNFEIKINKIKYFYRICKRKKMIKNYSTSIKILRKYFPDEIVLHISAFLHSENDFEINYLKNKEDIDLIIEQCGLNITKMKYVLNIYMKNKMDIVSTILEIINN